MARQAINADSTCGRQTDRKAKKKRRRWEELRSRLNDARAGKWISRGRKWRKRKGSDETIQSTTALLEHCPWTHEWSATQKQMMIRNLEFLKYLHITVAFICQINVHYNPSKTIVVVELYDHNWTRMHASVRIDCSCVAIFLFVVMGRQS